MSPYDDRKRMNCELEARIRLTEADYERYLLAGAYSHAAMRRRTRVDGVKLVTEAPDGAGVVSTPRESPPIQPELWQKP